MLTNQCLKISTRQIHITSTIQIDWCNSLNSSLSSLPVQDREVEVASLSRLASLLDAAEKLMVINGSYLRRDGTLVLDSLSKLYLCATREDHTLDVQLQGQPFINALVRSSREPTTVKLNDHSVHPDFNSEQQTVWLKVRPE